MAASGIDERRATLARLKTIAGGYAWQGSVDDAEQIPRTSDGKIYPHIVIDYGAPVRSARERNLTNADLDQPHILFASISCVAGDPHEAEDLMDAVVRLLVDWKPSASADPWELKNGFGGRRQGTDASPTRYIEGLFLETTVNQGVVST